MTPKKKLLKKSRLYIIIDKKTLVNPHNKDFGVGVNKSVFNIVSRIKRQEGIIIQLRDKESNKESILNTAYSLRKILANSKTLFIVNDYIDVAKLVDSDGLHLGQDDVSIAIARKILGQDKIIGISCHNLRQAQKAKDNKADYISIGPVFATPTKPEYRAVGLDLIKRVSDKIKMPIFAIGGIDEENVKKVVAGGIKRIAVCRAVCKASDPVKTVKNIKRVLEKLFFDANRR